jgi:hypothetical protein
VGGLMGETVGGTTVNCYSQGTVSGPGISGSYAGGLIGLVSIWADPDTSIADCYSAAQVANMNPGQLGGLVGSWQCSAPVSQAVTRCFWDKDASGCGSSPGGTGLTTAQMKDISTYLRVGWDFVGETTNGTEDIWKMPKFGGYPLLFWQEDKSTPAPPPPPAPTVEGFETKNFLACDWKRSGDQDWYITSDQKHSGLFSARAGTIGDDQTSTLELTRNCQAGKLSFFVKVSSESGPDRLVFTMDGQFIGDWSGEVGWMQASYSVPAGVHTFDWTYSKDDANDAGFDTAWLDDITFPPSQ